MIKLLIFDLDGTISNTSKLHFAALQKALSEIGIQYNISEETDLKYLGTLPTKLKLKIISQLNGLPTEMHEKVLELKRKFTLQLINEQPISNFISDETIKIIKLLKRKYLIYLASNTNREFIHLILNKSGLSFDFIICGDDVSSAKPNPEMFLRSFLHAGVKPKETIIFEDSISGQEAALSSGAHLFGVESPEDLSYEKIVNKINSIQNDCNKWYSEKTVVVIPMAGEGSRFKNAGYKTPKPLIDIRGLPMVAAVVRDLNINAKFVFIVKEEHEEEYHLSTILKLVEPSCEIVYVKGKQSGAATTILQADRFINNDSHLMIVNADQMWDWSPNIFYHSLAQQAHIDGSIVVFKDPLRDPKWSFARTNSDGLVEEVAEKQPISDLATAGIYWFRKGSDFVKYAEQMVAEGFKVNGEYYACPVYNFAIRDGKQINAFTIDKFWPTGTPEELNFYLANRKHNV